MLVMDKSRNRPGRILARSKKRPDRTTSGRNLDSSRLFKLYKYAIK